MVVSDVWGAYGRKKPGTFASHPCAFTDLDQLTMFADYRVPQLLRPLGILEYRPALAQRIDAFSGVRAAHISKAVDPDAAQQIARQAAE